MACLFPFYVENPSFPLHSTHRKVPVPCGKCPQCLQRRAAEWCFRLEQHEKVCDTSCFITLTYSTDYVPITLHGFMSLDRKAFSTCIRSVRKRMRNIESFKDVRLSYYVVGEYGSERKRPHYHAILFNLPDIQWRTDLEDRRIGFSPLLDASWPYGVIDIRECNGDTIGYTCKYLHKGKSVPAHRNDDRVPEFSNMSKGLGVNYVSPEVVRFHRSDLAHTYVVSNGYKKALPRYYRERIYSEDERIQIGLQNEQNSIDLDLAAKRDYVSRTGDVLLDDYARSIREAKEASVINFKARAASRRKDL